MTQRTEHRPAARVEYRGSRVGGANALVEVVKVFEAAEELPGWEVGDGYRWGVADDPDDDGIGLVMEAAARRRLAHALLLHLTNNPVLADDVAGDVADRLLACLPNARSFRLSAERLLEEVEWALLRRELGVHLDDARRAVKARLQESAESAKRRRLADLEAGRPALYFHQLVREDRVPPAVAGDELEPEQVIDLDAPERPSPDGTPVTEEDRRQLQADPFTDPDIPW